MDKKQSINKNTHIDNANNKKQSMKKMIVSVCTGVAVVVVFIAILIMINFTAKKAIGNLNVDLDLTILGDNMKVAEMFNIFTSPQDYLGNVLKVNGAYFAIDEPALGRLRHIILVVEADACCPPLGFEIILVDKNMFTFPVDGTPIEVVGTFSIHEEQGMEFYYILIEKIVTLN